MEHEIRRFNLVSCINTDNLTQLENWLHKEQFALVRIDGTNVKDKKTFLRQTANDLPHVEGLEPHSWDALADYLWFGLSELDNPQIAILWTYVNKMLDGGLSDLLTAVDCFTAVARGVANSERGFSQSTTLYIFLLGEGPNFPHIF